MQLNVWIVGVAFGLACPSCHCAKRIVHETFGAPPGPTALLARRVAQVPLASPPSTILGTGDPAATDAAAIGPLPTAAPVALDAAQVEMATTNDMLVRMAVENLTEFEGVVMRNLELICMVPGSQLSIQMQSALGGIIAPVVAEAPLLDEIPPHPSMAFAQRGRRLRRARSTRAASTAASRINLTAVMWVVYINPPNITAPENATNATNVTCTPCMCGPQGPDCVEPFCGLSANETAALQGRSSLSIAEDLVSQARGGDTPLHGLLPLTTARLPGHNFPGISKTSVAIGSQKLADAADSSTGRSIEATEINEGTQHLLQELRVRLMAANQRRADILTGEQAEPLAFDGFHVPVASKDNDPWSTLDFSAKVDQSPEGREAARH